ncbi:FAD-dependent oxidoreductase [Thermoleophilia bacterium SCSIO 60948]|nr:FAD-dependent oxidoreductase [Thermoleophilia bacterium SCSIO 60948]
MGDRRPPLAPGSRFDAIVVGGGITGLTTALMLRRQGLGVALIDQGRIATGVSGHTTAKVTSQHQAIYARLRVTIGAKRMRHYAEANEWAKEQVAAIAGEGIDCDLRRRPAYLYASDARELAIAKLETRAARSAGLPATWDEDPPLPFETRGAMRFDDQLEFHPVRYVAGLARLFEAEGGVIAEDTRATQVHEGDPCRVETEHGELEADNVVVATLMPFLDRGVFFARAYPTRSYVITARLASGAPPEGMLINAASPSRSIRAVPTPDGELLMVGGEGHDVGSSKATPERYEKLAEFARRHWDVAEITHRWSAQDYSSDDDVPYVGPARLGSKKAFVATGMRKWGMTNGVVAARLISDAIAGQENEWAPTFSSTRVRPLAEAPSFALENTKVGLHFVGDRLRERGGRPIEDLRPGEGAIVESDGQKVAGYRDDDGELHAVSSLCTHLYCQVRWNGAERTWDCPCHGSRFTVDGEILNGPAVKPLAVKVVEGDPFAARNPGG